MKDFRFAKEVNERIVNGILQGYKNYIQERMEKKNQMKISSAYAWVRGNHIDDQTAVECQDLGIEYRVERAGYTWGYLQFTSQSERSMFIIKNGKYFDEKDFTRGKGIQKKKKSSQNDENYLKKLSRINRNITFPSNSLPIQPSLFPDDFGIRGGMTIFDDVLMKLIDDEHAKKFQEDFEKFFIVTYEVDVANMISTIKVWMPNPVDNVAYLVEDLTEFIQSSSIDFSELDTTVLENDQLDIDYDSPNAIDFGIYHDNDISEEEGNGKG